MNIFLSISGSKLIIAETVATSAQSPIPPWTRFWRMFPESKKGYS